VFSKLRSWPAVAGLIIVAAVLVAAGCGDDNGGGGGASGLDTINSGQLRVGSDIPYPPFEFGREPDYQGFDVDLVNEIAKRLDLEAKFVKTPFDPIFRNLAQGRFDMVASAATITPEREKTIDFSDPYFPADQSLMVKRGSDVKTVDDLAGKTVGAQLGTTGADYAEANANAGDLRAYPQIDNAFNALVAGQVDAVIFDLSGTEQAAKTLEGLKVVQSFNTGEYLAPAYAEDNDALREAANKAFAEMKDDGTLAKAYQEWFKLDTVPKDVLEKTNTPQ